MELGTVGPRFLYREIWLNIHGRSSPGIDYWRAFRPLGSPSTFHHEVVWSSVYLCESVPSSSLTTLFWFLHSHKILPYHLSALGPTNLFMILNWFLMNRKRERDTHRQRDRETERDREWIWSTPVFSFWKITLNSPVTGQPMVFNLNGKLDLAKNLLCVAQIVKISLQLKRRTWYIIPEIYSS